MNILIMPLQNRVNMAVGMNLAIQIVSSPPIEHAAVVALLMMKPLYLIEIGGGLALPILPTN